MYWTKSLLIEIQKKKRPKMLISLSFSYLLAWQNQIAKIIQYFTYHLSHLSMLSAKTIRINIVTDCLVVKEKE